MSTGARAPGPIRLLFVVREKFPTYRVDVDVLFGRELLGRGHRIELIMQAGNANVVPGPHEWHGGTVWVGPCDPKPGFVHRVRDYLLGFFHEVKCIVRRAHARDFDAIQVKDRFLIACVALVVAKMRGLQFYYWLSFPFPESWVMRGRLRVARFPIVTRLRGLVTGWMLYRLILPRSDHAFMQSEQMKQEMVARGFDARKFSAVPMGIDLSAAGLAEPPPASDAGPVILVYLGAISAERRLDILVDMLGVLHGQGVKASMCFVGDTETPADKQALLARAKQLGVEEWVRFTGFLPRDAAFELVRSAHIGLSPICPSEIYRVSSPTKLVEYLSLGLPVVANDLPDQRLVLRGGRGGVCVPWGARHFARGVRWILRHSPEERRQMAMRGRAWVEAHRSYARIADDVERTYLLLRGSGRVSAEHAASASVRGSTR